MHSGLSKRGIKIYFLLQESACVALENLDAECYGREKRTDYSPQRVSTLSSHSAYGWGMFPPWSQHVGKERERDKKRERVKGKDMSGGHRVLQTRAVVREKSKKFKGNGASYCCRPCRRWQPWEERGQCIPRLFCTFDPDYVFSSVLRRHTAGERGDAQHWGDTEQRQDGGETRAQTITLITTDTQKKKGPSKDYSNQKKKSEINHDIKWQLQRQNVKNIRIYNYTVDTLCWILSALLCQKKPHSHMILGHLLYSNNLDWFNICNVWTIDLKIT